MDTRVTEIFAMGGPLAQAAGAGYEVRPGQIQMAEAIAAKLESGGILLVEGPTGCHAMGQGILLFDGRIKPVETIEVGDLLIGPDGMSRTVLQLCRGESEMVDVIPTKGKTWRVNTDHILTLVNIETGCVIDVSIGEYSEWSKWKRHCHKLFRCSVEEFEKSGKEFILSPYFLGIMLGDGTLANDDGVSITKPVLAIAAAVREEGTKFGLEFFSDGTCHRLSHGSNCGRTRNPILQILRHLGLSPIAGKDRFVPFEYKVASYLNRLEILAGLIDTDGSLDGGSRTGFDFISKSRRLADDVAFIARSVGLAAYVRPKECTGFGITGIYWRVGISGNTHIVPCRTAKKAPIRRQKKDALRTGIRVHPTGEIESYFGFVLDGDGRYLLDDFTVTHNTGKSVAYLVPAILQAIRQRKKVVVVTANIALQEQLIGKDLPMLQRAMPELEFTFALAKGLGNYLCLNLWDDAIAESLVNKHYGEEEIWDALSAWQLTTQTGDISELHVELPPRIRMGVTMSADDCIGKKCQHYADCHGMQARRKQVAADIVVTNYHLFFADLSIKATTDSPTAILPEYDYVIMDEVHQASDIARDFFGWRFSMGSVRWSIRLLPGDKQAPILSEAERFFYSVGQGPDGKPRKRPRIAKPHEVDGNELAQQLRQAADQLGIKAGIELVPEDKAKLQKAEARARSLAVQLECITEATQDAKNNQVYFGEPPNNDKGYWAIGMKPIDVAPILEATLFNAATDPDATRKIKAIIGTSATLTTAGTFDFIVGQLGAYEASELVVPSPFEHKGAAVLVVPRDLPDPKHALFAERVAEVVLETVLAAQGRTLALFTSYRVLKATHEYLLAQGLPYRILRQGDMPRTKLIAEFRRDVSSVLLGTDSFWEGIDVQGEALSAVVIDRLPFEHPEDPVFECICERDPKGWFYRYSLPKSILGFRQGFGRLIRSRTDRGAIVVCDRRIVDKPYGIRYLRSLPVGVDLKRSIDAVKEILG